MKKIISTATLVLAAVALAAPAQADGPEDWPGIAGPIPQTVGQEMIKAPLAPFVGTQKNNASNGNVLDHARNPLHR
ncbi:hypothetical protein AB0E83_09155 [Streptomyces sp. NPDC035033]|uniref:hypothetical protein n=1 Tax=Streptomyces sp. NPDC035033 TaxID=3155368 RepID=UPI0033C53FA7